jgi:hypothetical protein
LISRRNFILGSGLVVLAPRTTPLLSFDYSNGAHLIRSGPVDMIQQQYPFASTAILKLACWNDYLDSEHSAPDTCQFVQLSSNWKSI